MQGPNCGTPSFVSWPLITDHVDLFVGIRDRWAEKAVDKMEDWGIKTCETGAAGIAGLMALISTPDSKKCCNVSENSSVFFICTEADIK